MNSQGQHQISSTKAKCYIIIKSNQPNARIKQQMWKQRDFYQSKGGQWSWPYEHKEGDVQANVSQLLRKQFAPRFGNKESDILVEEEMGLVSWD